MTEGEIIAAYVCIGVGGVLLIVTSCMTIYLIATGRCRCCHGAADGSKVKYDVEPDNNSIEFVHMGEESVEHVAGSVILAANTASATSAFTSTQDPAHTPDYDYDAQFDITAAQLYEAELSPSKHNSNNYKSRVRKKKPKKTHTAKSLSALDQDCRTGSAVRNQRMFNSLKSIRSNHIPFSEYVSENNVTPVELYPHIYVDNTGRHYQVVDSQGRGSAYSVTVTRSNTTGHMDSAALDGSRPGSSASLGTMPMAYSTAPSGYGAYVASATSHGRTQLDQIPRQGNITSINLQQATDSVPQIALEPYSSSAPTTVSLHDDSGDGPIILRWSPRLRRQVYMKARRSGVSSQVSYGSMNNCDQQHVRPADSYSSASVASSYRSAPMYRHDQLSGHAASASMRLRDIQL